MWRELGELTDKKMAKTQSYIIAIFFTWHFWPQFAGRMDGEGRGSFKPLTCNVPKVYHNVQNPEKPVIISGNAVFHLVACPYFKTGVREQGRKAPDKTNSNLNKSNGGQLSLCSLHWRSAPQITAAVTLINWCEDKSTFLIPKAKMPELSCYPVNDSDQRGIWFDMGAHSSGGYESGHDSFPHRPWLCAPNHTHAIVLSFLICFC